MTEHSWKYAGNLWYDSRGTRNSPDARVTTLGLLACVGLKAAGIVRLLVLFQVSVRYLQCSQSSWLLQTINTHTPYSSEFYRDVVHEGITHCRESNQIYQDSKHPIKKIHTLCLPDAQLTPASCQWPHWSCWLKSRVWHSESLLSYPSQSRIRIGPSPGPKCAKEKATSVPS